MSADFAITSGAIGLTVAPPSASFNLSLDSGRYSSNKSDIMNEEASSSGSGGGAESVQVIEKNSGGSATSFSLNLSSDDDSASSNASTASPVPDTANNTSGASSADDSPLSFSSTSHNNHQKTTLYATESNQTSAYSDPHPAPTRTSKSPRPAAQASNCPSADSATKPHQKASRSFHTLRNPNQPQTHPQLPTARADQRQNPDRYMSSRRWTKVKANSSLASAATVWISPTSIHPMRPSMTYQNTKENGRSRGSTARPAVPELSGSMPSEPGTSLNARQ